MFTPPAETYENNSRHYSALDRAARLARHLGLVDPEDMIDRRNEEVRLYGADDYRYAHETTVQWEREQESWSVPAITWETLPDLAAPNVFGYDYDPADQPVNVEVWVEKSGVDDVLNPICREEHVNLLVGAGYESITRIVETLRERTTKPTRILYISDHDPAGNNMPVQVARHIEFYVEKYAPGADVMVRPIVLTTEQVREYELPHAPDEMKVELDALEAMRPGVLANIVREAIDEWKDDDIESELMYAGSDAEAAIEEQWNEALDEAGIIDRLADLTEKDAAARKRLDRRIKKLTEDIATIYEPIADEWESIVADVLGIEQGFDPSLPDRPTGRVPDVDTDDYLFDSDRDYFDQLDYYRERKPRPVPRSRHKATRERRERPDERACPECGTSLAGRKWGTVFCSEACRARVRRREGRKK